MSYLIYNRNEIRSEVERILEDFENGIETLSKSELLMKFKELKNEIEKLRERLRNKIIKRTTSNFVLFKVASYKFFENHKRSYLDKDKTINICEIRRQDYKEHQKAIDEICIRGDVKELLDFAKKLNSKYPKIYLYIFGNRRVDVYYSDNYFIEGIKRSEKKADFPYKVYLKHQNKIDDLVNQNNLNELLSFLKNLE